MRYFLEVSYKGTNYSGFQIQHNANTIQAEVEKVLEVFYKEKFNLTGSSRTDAGVHALQNFFHFDSEINIKPESLYNLNSILPGDIVLKRIKVVEETAHCRFGAISIDWELVQGAAEILKEYSDFTSFSKRNTQVKNFRCRVSESKWLIEDDCLIYTIEANRFLRGMVRALTATMLLVGRKKINILQFKEIIESKDCTKASFAVPAAGLFLIRVNYPEKE